MNKGFSVLEVILAVALFVIFSVAAIKVIVQSFNANRQGVEFTIANQFASEGIEAVKSIKNQAYSNLSSTTYPNGTGVMRNTSTGVWQFRGDSTTDTLTHNVSDNFIRKITISSVGRDAAPPNGNILASGGTPDPDSQKITSTVTWNFNSARPESMSLISYLTDWRKPISNAGDGLALYGDSTSITQPRYRTYTNSSNIFSNEAAAGSSYSDSVVGKSFKLKTNPTKLEAIAGYVNSSGVLRILCFDGSAWTSEWTQSVGGSATNDQRFGIAFEQTSGDVLVVYSNNGASATNELGYRTKLGSTGCGSTNWSSHNNLDPIRTSGVIHWIRMESKPTSGANDIALVWADSNSDLSGMIWNGSSFGAEPAATLETNLERVTSSQDVQSFDIAYESVSGNLMIVWGLYQATSCTAGTTIATTNCIRYARYTTSWQAVAVIPTVADPATHIDISANPNTNELVTAALDNSQADLSIAYWSGSAWTGKANQDTATLAATAGTKFVATGWLISGTTTRSIIVYADSSGTGIDWVVGSGSSFTTQTDCTTACNPATGAKSWFDIQMDPKNKDRLMLTLADGNSDLFAKRLVMTSTPAFTWSDANGVVALETNLGQTTSSPYGYAYWRNP